MQIKGKVVVVTGASSGIGESSAKLLTKKGAKVALVVRSRNKLKKLSQELSGSLAVPADMTKISEIKRMIKKVKQHFGRVDILINNAGQGYDALIEKINISVLRRIFNLDVIGPLSAMQQVIPLMRTQGGGVIVNISSGTALLNLPGMGGYSSLKKALVGISLTAREELKKDNIIVSVVYPYITLTDFEKNTIKGEMGEDFGEGGGPPNPPDTAEHVAQKILDAIENGEAEVYAHEWMKNE